MGDLLRKQVDDYKREILIKLLIEKEGNVAAVGRALKRSKTSMWTTIQRLGINPGKYRPKNFKPLPTETNKTLTN